MKIDANEARRLNDEFAAKQQISMEEIEKRIQREAADGKSLVKIHLEKIDYSYRTRLADKVIKELIANGFSAKRQSHSSYRDSFDYIEVRW